MPRRIKPTNRHCPTGAIPILWNKIHKWDCERSEAISEPTEAYSPLSTDFHQFNQSVVSAALELPSINKIQMRLKGRQACAPVGARQLASNNFRRLLAMFYLQ